MMDYKAQEASIVLLKALRVFKNDLLLCEKLAHAQALSHKPAEAYFTKAQCYILEAMPLEALRQLKLARSMSQDNGLLKARIEAKLNEIIT